MLPKWHLLFGLIISLLLYPLFSWKVLLFFAPSVLIDFDHYFIYIIKRGDLSLKNAYIIFKKLDEKQKDPNFKGFYTFFLCIFHTYEFLFIILILSIIYNQVSLLLIGLIYHLIIDIIFIKTIYTKKYFSFYLRNLSLMYHLFTRDKKGFGEVRLKV